MRFGKKGPCNHRFVNGSYIVLEGKLRQVQICKKCKTAVHVPVLTKKQLREVEDAEA